MQESRSNLRSLGGKHTARILPVAIIICFPLIALSLHVQSGDLPSYSSILVNARCCVQVVNWCFGSTVLTLARFFLLPLWQLLLVFAGFWWFLPAAGSSFLAVTFPGLWWAEFHAEKGMGAKLVGLPGYAVAVATMLGEDPLSAVLGKKGCMKPAFHCELMRKTHLR